MRFLPALFLFLIACSGTTNTTPSEYTKFIYKFHDSSVPPEYHRSFTITVTPNSIEKFVDSYGDSISYEKKEITSENFTELKENIKNAGIKNCKTSGRDNCNGGTGISIYFYDREKEVFKGYAAQCSGQNTGDMCGEFEKVLTFLNSLLTKQL